MTLFRSMYHPDIPSTITQPVDVPQQAIDDQAARGWLLVDPDFPEPPPATPYVTRTEADSRYLERTDVLDVGGLVLEAALPARLGDVAQRTASATALSSGMEVADHFRDYPNGTLTAAPTGQAYLYEPSTGTSKARVVSGVLTNAVPSGSSGASYFSAQLADSGRVIGGRFRFYPGSTGTGSAVFPLWAVDIGASYAAGTGVPDSPCHFVITKTGWSFDCYQNGSIVPNPNPSTANGQFLTPLLDDGTIYTAQAVIDRENSCAYLWLPDGQVARVSHPLIGTTVAPFACWENFKYVATDSNSGFVEIWATSRRSDSLVPSQRAYLAAASPTVYSVTDRATAADASFTVPGTPTQVGAVSLSFIAPASGLARLEAQAFLDITADGLFFFQVMEGGATIRNVLVGAKVSSSGICRLDEHVNVSPGPHTWTLHAWSAGGTATLKLHEGGADAYHASMAVTPVVA